jgi:hypothetical protein
MFKTLSNRIKLILMFTFFQNAFTPQGFSILGNVSPFNQSANSIFVSNFIQRFGDLWKLNDSVHLFGGTELPTPR